MKGMVDEGHAWLSAGLHSSSGSGSGLAEADAEADAEAETDHEAGHEAEGEAEGEGWGLGFELKIGLRGSFLEGGKGEAQVRMVKPQEHGRVQKRGNAPTWE